MKIKKITKITNNSKKYDIEVKNNHNFFANGILVHNCTMYNDHLHARSLDSIGGKDRDWVKGLWGKISYLLDDNMRICGENLFAFHSIEYTDLSSYFHMFSMWIDMKCLSWDETEEFAKILSLETVPVFYRGIYNKDKIINAFKSWDSDNHAEGYVIRLAGEFNYADFRKSIAKYVKPEFRQKVNESHTHWRTKKIEKNLLK